jgi:7,8-dihydropterin-6-yl-methyl-4-(beta-D-ribofuranosyl)aminobenzene 5'-phosphate synthase
MSNNRTLSRREFLKMAGIAVSAAALEACSPQGPQSTTTTTRDSQTLTITIVYNNVPHDTRLATAWGFGAMVEYRGQTVLFDTGGDSPTLLGNMAILEKDPASIQKVVLSHIHGDHVGGLEGLLATGVRPTVYVPPSFPDAFKDQVSAVTSLVEVEPGQAIADGMFSTGEMPDRQERSLVEQALVVESRGGLVIITGCAHPGIVEIVTQAKDLFGGPVFLVMGGFHLRDKSRSQIRTILARLRELEVQRVAPSHCTGDVAIEMFADEYGDHFIHSGAGSFIVI